MTAMQMGQDACILLAHGARDPQWSTPFETMAAQLRTATGWPAQRVQLAFLERMSPSLLAAGHDLAQDPAVARVFVLPVFLGQGGHVRKDIPGLIDTLQAQHPQVRWCLTPALGEQAVVIRALCATAHQLITAAQDGPPA